MVFLITVQIGGNMLNGWKPKIGLKYVFKVFSSISQNWSRFTTSSSTLWSRHLASLKSIIPIQEKNESLNETQTKRYESAMKLYCLAVIVRYSRLFHYNDRLCVSHQHIEKESWWLK